MSPKKQSGAGSSDGQNTGGYGQEDINPEEMTEEMLFQFIHAPEFLTQMASSSDPKLKEVLKFLENKLQDYYGKMKATKGEIAKRSKEQNKASAKARAAEKAEAKKVEKATKRQAKKTITVLFNGQSFTMSLSGTTTVGSFRKRLINMWNEANPDKPIALGRSAKIAVLDGVEKLHLHPRATLLSYGLENGKVLHCSFMADEDEDAESSIVGDGTNIDDEEGESDEEEED